VRGPHLPVHRGAEFDGADEHEASTSKIGEDQLSTSSQRGVSAEDATSMIVNGFCKAVFKELPMEFAVEAQKLLNVSGRKRRLMLRLDLYRRAAGFTPDARREGVLKGGTPCRRRNF